jgi:hypothetical protein
MVSSSQANHCKTCWKLALFEKLVSYPSREEQNEEIKLLDYFDLWIVINKKKKKKKSILLYPYIVLFKESWCNIV